MYRSWLISSVFWHVNKYTSAFNLELDNNKWRVTLLDQRYALPLKKKHKTHTIPTRWKNQLMIKTWQDFGTHYISVFVYIVWSMPQQYGDIDVVGAGHESTNGVYSIWLSWSELAECIVCSRLLWRMKKWTAPIKTEEDKT